MRRFCVSVVLFISFYICFCLCELSDDEKGKFTSAFINHLNKLPSQQSLYADGELIKDELILNENVYKIHMKVKATDADNSESSKYMNCTGILIQNDGQSTKNDEETIQVQDASCADLNYNETDNEDELVSDLMERGPIQLDNEVQPTDAVTSGEQFIAIPRRTTPCIGCASQVDINAAGVPELANLGVKQLDRHEPNTRHNLDKVIAIERQVQVTGGVRYIMVLTIDYDNCTAGETETCNIQKTCAVSILEKPWQKLPDGSKFRAILSNNCTEEWLFGDNGEQIPIDSTHNPALPTSQHDKDTSIPEGENVVPVHQLDLQSLPQTEKTLTDEQMKELEEQIITHTLSKSTTEKTVSSSQSLQDTEFISKDTAELEASKPLLTTTDASSITINKKNDEPNSISVDKQQAVDELMQFFDFDASKFRQKRDTQLTGGENEEDVDDPKYQTMAKESLQKYLKSTGRTQHHKVVQIDKITVQIVAGTITQIDFKVSPTNCELDDNGLPSAEQCEVQNNAKRISCHSSIWERPWLNKKEIKTRCNFHNKKSKRIRDLSNAIENDENYSKTMQLAQEALTFYLLSYGKEQHHKILKLENLKFKKAKFGELITVDFEAAPTNCQIQNAQPRQLNDSHCEVLNGTDILNCHSEITELENHRLLDVNCQDNNKIIRRRRHLAVKNGPSKKYSSDNEIPIPSNVHSEKLAEISLTKYLLTSHITQHHKVIQIDRVTVQPISGTLTRIDFKVTPTNCVLDEKGVPTSTECVVLDSNNILNCHSEISEKLNQEINFVTITCYPVKLKESKNLLLLGGEVTQSLDDPKYKILAEESIRQILLTSGVKQHYKVIKIEKVTIQSVSGTLTRIEFKVLPTNCMIDSKGEPVLSNCKVNNFSQVVTCNSEIWEEDRIKEKDISVKCTPVITVRSKFEPTSGEKVSQSPLDPKYIKLAEEALTKYLLSSHNLMYHIVVEIKNVFKFIDSDLLVSIDFIASPTNCFVGGYGEPNESYCKVIKNGNTLSCHSKILDSVSEKEQDITVNCTPIVSRQLRSIPGGETTQSPNDPKYAKLADESLTKYLLTSGTNRHHKVIKVNKVTTQVVSGTLTHIDFEVSPTNCLIDSNGLPTSTNCEVLNPYNVLYCHSEIWEQPWVKKKDITVNCTPTVSRQKRSISGGATTLSPNLSRQLRQVAGGITTQPPNDPKYGKLADESLTKYLLTSGTLQHYKVVKVNQVTTQVVSGSLTRIDFEVSPTNCLIDSNGVPTSTNCEVLNPYNVLKCHSEIREQPWVKRKDITVNCTPTVSRLKRSIPGGATTQSPNDPKYAKLADESLTKYLLTSGTNRHHKVIKVNKVTTQVVSGTLTHIDFEVSPTNCLIDSNGLPTSTNCEVLNPYNVLYCHSEIWEQPWVKRKDITVNCTPTVSRQKRSISGGATTLSPNLSRQSRQLVGGITTQLPNDPKYGKLAEESLTKYLLTSGTIQHYKVVKVNQVTTQVVSGSLTRIDFEVSPTNCLVDSNGVPTSTNCEVLNPYNVLYCHSEIWEQPWVKRKDITVNCTPTVSRLKRSIPGGATTQSPNDPKYGKLADESLTKYLLTSGTNRHHKVIKVNKVTTQVVSGTLTHIDFEVSPTNCLIDSNGLPTSTNCEVLNPYNVLYCHSEIWEQPWVKRKDITVNCTPTVSRQKRSISGGATTLSPNLSRQLRQVAGGITTQPPNDPKYGKLADESLTKYLLTSGTLQHYKVVKVNQVTTQVVSGSLTRIDFEVSPTNCLIDSNGVPTSPNCEVLNPYNVLKCHSEIREQPWVKRKDITVNCTPTVSRLKRSIPGGATTQSPNDPKYGKLADESLTKYLLTSGTNRHHKVIKVNKVTTQVVSGTLTHIDFEVSPTNCLIDSNGLPTSTNCEVLNPYNVLYCHSEIWEQPWVKKKDITVNCTPTVSRQKRSISGGATTLSPNLTRQLRQVAGGEKTQSPNDPKYGKIAEESLTKYLLTSGSIQHYKVVKVNQVTTQVVSGSLTRIDFEVSPTNCLVDSNGVPTSTNCEVLNPYNILKCHSEIWEQPWKKKKDITVNCSPVLLRQSRDLTLVKETGGVPKKFNYKVIEVKTSESRSERSIAEKRRSGGLREQDPTKLEYQQLAKDAIRKYEGLKKSKFDHKIIEVKRVITQIVSGVIYKIEFTAAPTLCLSNVSHLDECELDKSSILYCYTEIWSRPWLKMKKIEVHCNAEKVDDEDDNKLKTRNKRSFSQENENLNNLLSSVHTESAMQLAKEALKHIEYKYPHVRRQKIARILSLEKQNVAGVHYRMKLEVGYTNCMALSVEDDCELVTDFGNNKLCKVNIWLHSSPDRLATYRVTCAQEGNATDVYHQIQSEQLFVNFISTYKPNYMNDHEEMSKKFHIFKDNVQKIHELNVHEQGTARYAVTRFADLSPEEFKRKYLGLNPSLRSENEVPLPQAVIPERDIPASIDWRDYGAVTEVKDQGMCGSCWAFSVTGNVEGQWKKKTGKLLSLSEQELVDCDTLDQGCNGGLPDNAYRAIEQLGGLETETDYPYEGVGEKCSLNATLTRVQISGAVNISSNETKMAAWLVENGPISIGINANAMQFYVGGVSHPWKMLCNPKNLDHGVLIVGYGMKEYPLFNKKLPYWLIKNSWGKSWGEQGYYRVYRGDGTCGVNQMASSAVV